MRRRHSAGPRWWTEAPFEIDRDRDRHILDQELVDRLHPKVGERYTRDERIAFETR